MSDTYNGNNSDNDTALGSLNDLMFGRGGRDNLSGGGANDTIFGGDGFDTAAYDDGVGAVTVDLAAGTATHICSGFLGAPTAGTDSLVGIEAVQGSAGAVVGDAAPTSCSAASAATRCWAATATTR